MNEATELANTLRELADTAIHLVLYMTAVPFVSVLGLAVCLYLLRKVSGR